jgi:hypothetical protein
MKRALVWFPGPFFLLTAPPAASPDETLKTRWNIADGQRRVYSKVPPGSPHGNPNPNGNPSPDGDPSPTLVACTTLFAFIAACGRNFMSRKAADDHHQVAHHQHTARHHKEAAKHHLAGKHQTTARNAYLARSHPEHAIWVGLIVLCFICLKPPTTSAQAVYGSILGTVTDTQGAAVPGAKVTVTSVNKGTSDETTTNESGNYSVTHLIPDTYKVRIESQGFKVTEIPSVLVSADTSARVDATMQVGAVTQSVEVTSEFPQLNKDRAEVDT